MRPTGYHGEAFGRLAELARGALELLLPPTCAGCGARTDPTSVLCARCDARLERIAPIACQLCQEIAPRPGRDRCADCEASSSPLTACIAGVRFEGAASEWIHGFKYPRPGLRGLDPAPAAVAGAMLREAALRTLEPRPDLVVPVPLHARRLRSRGFNPAAELARSLARDLELPFDAVALCRTRDTPSQTGLDRNERRRNVRGAFCARGAGPLPERIWLVDDVVTTASTLAEAALALKAAGARTVIGLCAARSLSNRSVAGHG